MKKHALRRHTGFHNVLLDGFIVLCLLLVVLLSIYPLYYVLIASLTHASVLNVRPIYLLPGELTLANYQIIFDTLNLFNPLMISLARTVLGVLVTVLCTSMVGYVLSHRDLKGARFWVPFFVFTMYFNAGIIPTFLLVDGLGLTNSFWVYILPSVVSVYEMILVKAYIQNIPASMEESAKIDGANEVQIFFRLMLPLMLPILATIAIFIGVTQWNAWYDTYLYNYNSLHLWTLQMHLKDMLDQASSIRVTSTLDALKMSNRQATPLTLRLSITVVTTVPIILIYPFFQRYFISGIMLGAVKE
ncbi:MAG: carbohydrate ABC transporter permease [Clostridiales bacterium]|jgi:putative aldouronate transport system permease protein|nr:carbohydrate ABC transporter permease [Clostridiales bacterium]